MRWRRFFGNLLFPPRCVGCREFLQSDVLDVCDEPLCRKCRLAWEREKCEICPDCNVEMSLCRCYPERMKKAGVSETIKLISYYNNRETVGRRAILSLKKRLHVSAARFFAAQLSYPVKRYMEEKGLAADEVAICYVPRGRKNRAVYGFDQSEWISRCLAKCLGLREVALFRRVGRGEHEQKKMSHGERFQNSEGKFAVNGKALPQLTDVKCLLIFDDVITSGASFCACAKALSGHFTGSKVAVCIARTPRRANSREK